MKPKKAIGILAIATLLYGCGHIRPNIKLEEGDNRAKYYEQIRDWQQRIKEEGWIYGKVKTKFYEQIKEWEQLVQEKGWTRGIVDKIIRTVKWRYSDYTLEKPEDTPKGYRWAKDYWKTPLDMINDDFKGDCEDIAGLFFGVLKRLKYPHEVRMSGMRYVLGDHALIRVEMPDGKWKLYEILKNPLAPLDRIYSIEEWDENDIWVRKLKDKKYVLKQITIEKLKEVKKK